MGHKRRDTGIEAFNNAAVRNGLTYAEAQRRETEGKIKQIRAPRTEKADGQPVYMKVSARNTLKRLKEEEEV